MTKIPPGSFSGSFPGHTNVSEPKKISPVQHHFLKKNNPYLSTEVADDELDQKEKNSFKETDLVDEKEDIEEKNQNIRTPNLWGLQPHLQH